MSGFTPINRHSSPDAGPSSALPETQERGSSVESSQGESEGEDMVPGPFFCNSTPVFFDQGASRRQTIEYWRTNLSIRGVSLPLLKLLLEHLTIEFLKGAARGRYVRWRISSNSFWVDCSIQNPYKDFAMSRGLEGSLPLYVDIREGGPTGLIIAQMAKDKRRLRGLPVQIHGLPNEVPCATCERHFRSSDSSAHAGMWPFFGCRSVPGFFDGDCGNCLSSVETCSLRDPRCEALRARTDREPPLIEDLTEENSRRGRRYKGRELMDLVLDKGNE
ncbi:hypothetical protein K445DRAFT_27577 [Daldinia sp. EC12]|nr:hypothetical protein K445DRAFT_27577 [Daldinia sp. EC12]